MCVFWNLVVVVNDKFIYVVVEIKLFILFEGELEVYLIGKGKVRRGFVLLDF